MKEENIHYFYEFMYLFLPNQKKNYGRREAT